MKFMMGESGWAWLERASFRGGIGLYYNDTWGGVLTYITFGIILILAIIGLFSVLKWIAFGRKTKEDPGKKWLKTGKF